MQDAPEIWEYNEDNIKYLPYNNNVKLYCPDPIINLKPIDLSEKHIDVLFYGSMTDRRQYILDKLIKLGYNVVISNKIGDDLNYEISHSKILLNIHSEEHYVQETGRLCRWIGNGYIISEKSNINYYPNYIHEYIYDDIVNAVSNYLNNL